MSQVERYQGLMKQVEDAKQHQAEAKGSLAEIKERLKETFGCSSLKEAKTKLKTLEGSLKIAITEADDLMDEMEEALNNARLD